MKVISKLEATEVWKYYMNLILMDDHITFRKAADLTKKHGIYSSYSYYEDEYIIIHLSQNKLKSFYKDLLKIEVKFYEGE
jgi:hypothetical protein